MLPDDEGGEPENVGNGTLQPQLCERRAVAPCLKNEDGILIVGGM